MSQHHIDDALHLSHTVQPGRNQFSTPSPQEPDRRFASPPYDNCDAYYFSLNPSMAERMAADEESRCGFWGEGDALLEEQKAPRSNTKRANLSFYKSFSFLLTVLYCISVGNSALFGFDLILTQFGLGFGLARWLVIGPDTSYNMHFCLATTNRQVPGPQTWRYINPNDIAGCRTEVFTLSASVTEQWKLRFGDESIFGEDIRYGGDGRVDEDEKMRVEVLGDDLAGEGTDRALDVYPDRYTMG